MTGQPVECRPYADSVQLYRQLGWRGTLPLPPGQKHNPPDGWTGAHEHDPSDAWVHYWATNGQAAGNIALRLPHDVIGIDVDAYDCWRPHHDPATGLIQQRWTHKRGAETLAQLEAALGPLPPTWRSSARAAPSGVYLYRIPAGAVITESAIPGDIEIIRRGHRYMVAAPSVNPETGTAYGWSFGSNATGWQPAPRPPRLDLGADGRSEINWLPPAWLVRLASRPATSSTPVADFWATAKTTDSAARQWARLRDRFVGFVRRCELFGWGGDAHSQLLELTRELAQLAPEHAHRAVGEWFRAAGAGYIDWRVWAMLESALGKYPADKIVAPAVYSRTGDVLPTVANEGTAGATNSSSGAFDLTSPGTAGDSAANQGSSAAPVEQTGPANAGGSFGTGAARGISGGAAAPVGNALVHPTVAAALPGATTVQQPSAPRRLPMIPDAVWDHYGWTRSIRAQARAADVCPDAVLGAMLANYAAKIPPGLRIVTGTKMPLGANLVVALVGPSGSDKSTAFALAQQMAPSLSVPVVNNPGSGEAFAASLTHPDPDYDGPPRQRPKVLKPHPHALFYVSEGALLGSVAGRLGSTWLPHLRALAVDESLSTTNATSEINRQVPAQRYRAAVVVGFQVSTATTVLHDTGTGTAQRFLWFTSLSSEDPAAQHTAPIQHTPMAGPNVTGLGQADDEHGERLYYLTVARSITERIVAEQRHDRLTRDITATDDHDAHRHTLTAKLAAIAVLADGRVMIDERDWAWAEALYAASAAVRGELLDLAEETARTDQARRGQEMARTDRARRGFDADEVRVAEVILRRIDRGNGYATRREIHHAIAGRDRGLMAGAIEQLINSGHIRRSADGRGYMR